MSSRKYCIVPKCKNTTVTTPNKLFFCVPRDEKIRKKWCEVARRDDKIPLSSISMLYCCEDHFDVETDMDNYLKYQMMGGQLKLKRGVLPHKFACQMNEEKNPVKMRSKQSKTQQQIEHIEIELNPDTFHGDLIPRDQPPLLKCQLWIEVCQRPDLRDKPMEQLYNMRVCGLHFAKWMYMKKNLKSAAIPVLNLPSGSILPMSTQAVASKTNIIEDLNSRGVQHQIDVPTVGVSVVASNSSQTLRTTNILTDQTFYSNLYRTSTQKILKDNAIKVNERKKLLEMTLGPEREPEAKKRKKDNDKCCCCLGEDGDRSLWSSEENNGDNNVYGKLLQECFDITIGNQKFVDFKICNTCKEQLKQALQFKRQVLECQQRITTWKIEPECQLPDNDSISDDPLAALQRNKGGIAAELEVKYNQYENVEYVEPEPEVEIKVEPLPEEQPDPLNANLEVFLEPKVEFECVESTTDDYKINADTVPECIKPDTNTVQISAVKQMEPIFNCTLREMLPQHTMQDMNRRGHDMLHGFNEPAPAAKPHPQLRTVRRPRRPNHTEELPTPNTSKESRVKKNVSNYLDLLR